LTGLQFGDVGAAAHVIRAPLADGDAANVDGGTSVIGSADVITRTAASNVAEALVTYASEVGATQLVLGNTRRSRLSELLSGSVVRDVLQLAADIDIHLVTDLEHPQR